MDCVTVQTKICLVNAISIANTIAISVNSMNPMKKERCAYLKRDDSLKEEDFDGNTLWVHDVMNTSMVYISM